MHVVIFINMATIIDLPSTEMNTILFFEKQVCGKGHDMKLYINNDEAIWRCSIKS